jgi:hypothetical protein
MLPKNQKGFEGSIKPDAANPAIAPQLQAERHWRRVADPER